MPGTGGSHVARVAGGGGQGVPGVAGPGVSLKTRTAPGWTSAYTEGLTGQVQGQYRAGTGPDSVQNSAEQWPEQ